MRTPYKNTTWVHFAEDAQRIRRVVAALNKRGGRPWNLSRALRFGLCCAEYLLSLDTYPPKAPDPERVR